MKFIYLGITSLMIIVSIFFGFMAFNTQSAVNEKVEDIELMQQRHDTLDEKSTQLQEELSAAVKELEEKTAEYEKVKASVYYKQNPTAFLTFDDGPSKYTSQILDILKENDIKATFFCSAVQLDGTTVYDDVLKRIVDEGHTLAVHTYSHDYETIYSSKEAFFDDFHKAKKLLEEKSGTTITMARLPSGTSSAKGFCQKYGGSDTLFEEIMNGLKDEGITVSDWNVDTYDWSSKTTKDSIPQNVKSAASRRLSASYKTALVLMHNKEKSTQALSGVIAVLKDLGYAFEPMTSNGYTYVQKTK